MDSLIQITHNINVNIECILLLKYYHPTLNAHDLLSDYHTGGYDGELFSQYSFNIMRSVVLFS